MPEVIESPTDERVADYVGLKSQTPRTDGLLIAETEGVVLRLPGSPFEVRSFLLTQHRYQRMKAMIDAVDAPVYVAERELITEIAGFNVHRGVLASVRIPVMPTLDEVLGTAQRLVVIEASNDLDNLGAIARSAHALGFDAMVLDPRCADPLTRRSVRVSMGALLHLPVVRCPTWPDPLQAMIDEGFETWALTPKSTANSLFDMGMPDRVALVAGAEDDGLTPAALSKVHYDVRIPMHHGVDSLNIGHALAIAMAAVSLPPGE